MTMLHFLNLLRDFSLSFVNLTCIANNNRLIIIIIIIIIISIIIIIIIISIIIDNKFVLKL